jgi:hypothetical protein
VAVEGDCADGVMGVLRCRGFWLRG